MKKLGYSGQSLVVANIVGAVTPWDGKAHGAWPTHAVGGVASAVQESCASGDWVAAVVFTLTDGTVYNYPWILADFDTVQASINSWIDFPFLGETFNAQIRGQVFDKVTGADWGAWKAGH